MRVRVDESRNERAEAEISIGAIGSIGARANVDDAAAQLDHRAVPNRR
jgi:hypothetical protein